MSDERRNSPDSMDEDTLLALASAEIRREHAPAEAVEAAAARVWERLETGSAGAGPEAASLRSCADLQSLIPAYLRGDLRPERALLLEDHARECIPCRRALQAARSAPSGFEIGGEPRPAVRGARVAWLRRGGLAAALLLLLGGGYALLRATLFAPAGTTATVEPGDGTLYRVAGETVEALKPGATVRVAEHLRTAKDGGAVLRLADGSRVELRERTELALERRGDGAAIRLERGDIIVQAARQQPGRHLYVATDDCLVSVVGTIFAVDHGTKGSRVAVLEGEVHVAQGRRQSVLRPGDQLATHRSLAAVPLADQVAWSRDADRYLKLARELRGLGRELEAAVDRQGLRSSTALLDLVPASTAVYVAMPNVAESLADAHALLERRIQESQVLQQWWQERMVATGAAERLRAAIEHLRDFGGYLGSEVVVAVSPADAAATRQDGDLLLLAEIARSSGLDAFLEQEIARLNREASVAHGADAGSLRLVRDLSTAAPAGAHELLVWHDDGVLAASPSLDRLRALAALRQGAGNPFAATPFRARLAAVYANGAGWLLGVDLARIMAGEPDARGRAALQSAGFDGVRYLVLERRTSGADAESRAELTFDGPRRGVAAWLAAPAPMGSLEFVTPEAKMYAGFVVKSPASMMDDLLAIAEAGHPGAAARLQEFEQREGISLRDDLAAPLGGEIAFAFDGPLLPQPAWKVVVEVYDAARLQTTIEQLLARANAEAAAAGRPQGRLETSTSGGRTFYTLTLPGTGLAASYTFADGYLVAAPSVALLERSLQARAAGVTLGGAERFTALLPQDGHANFSALIFQDLGSTMQPLLGLLGSQALTPEQRQALSEMARDARPTLTYAYGEADRIVAALRGGGPFGLDLDWLLRLGVAGSALGRPLSSAHAPAPARVAAAPSPPVA